MSAIQDDSLRLQNSYRRLLKLSAFIVFPLMMGLASMASPLIRVILTAKWDGCVLYLQILCFALMLYPIHAINLNLLQVKGRSDIFLRLEIIKKIIGVVILIITIPLGITAMCLGMVFSSIICLIVNTYYTSRFIDVGLLTQLKDLRIILINSLVMGGGIYILTSFIDIEGLKLVMGIVIGFLLYFIGSFYFSKAELQEVISLIKKK